MKILLSKLAIFFALLAIAILLISRFDNINKDYKNFNIAKIYDSKKFDGLDILFVGNSYCYSGIDPAFFDARGIKTYNFGVASAGLGYIEITAREYLEYAKTKPKSIFIIISRMMFSSGADNIVELPIHRYLSRPLSHIKYACTIDPSKARYLFEAYRISMAKAFANFKNRIIYGRSAAVQESPLYKGYYSSNDKYDRNNTKEEEKAYLHLLKDSLHAKKALSKIGHIARQLAAQKIEVVLVEVPTNILKSYFNDKFNLEYSKLINKLKERYEYIIIPESLFTDSVHYRNIDHLNSEGAKLATSYLIKRLEEKRNRILVGGNRAAINRRAPGQEKNSQSNESQAN